MRMKSLPPTFQLDQYNVTPADVTQMAFHCPPDAIHPDVIFMPIWQPEIFSLWVDEITTITPNVLYELVYQGKPVSIVRSGVGAPLAGDATLALGCTACQRIWFAGSVGALRQDMRIGDLLVPDFAFSGDGFCRYLQPGPLTQDCFLEKCAPDEALTGALARRAALLAKSGGITLHTGPVFSSDTILAQFSRLGYISTELGCAGIEMETAAVFKAARSVGIRAAALLSISDVPVVGKSLFAGRPPAEREHRRETRKKILAKALLDCLHTREAAV